MKRVNLFGTGLFVLLLGFGLSSCNKEDNDETVELTQQEKDDLLTLREEEKLARDVYLYAYDKYGQGPFGSISNSEQRHMDAILQLLNKYGLPDPASPDRGVFNNQTLQDLYNTLTAQVDLSYVDALTVGATIEDLDLKDIEEFKARTDKADILDIYQRLRCGSRNHMRTYYSDLQTEGVTYTAQYITQTELEEIINSPNEQCGRN